MPRILVLAPLLALLAGCSCDCSLPTCSASASITVEGDTVEVTGCTGDRLVLQARVEGEGDLTLTWEERTDRLQPRVHSTAGGTLHAVVLEGTWELRGDAEPVWWRQGYQSWSWSGVTSLEAPQLVDGLPAVGGDGDTITVLSETAPTSWWAALLGRPGGGLMHLGALSTDLTKVWMASGPEELWVVWGGRGEALPVPAGAEGVALDPVLVQFETDAEGTPSTLWEDYATAAYGAAEPRGTGLDAPAPTGWSDWYTFYGTATEEDIRGNLALLGELEVMQVDDGWERAWGDWQANERFPSGMATLASDIESTGHTPGLWMAPFHVDRSTTTFQDHPDWFVRGADGEPLGSVSCDCGVLDVTHPDAAAWMGQQVADRVAEGWRYLKLDFLFGGALEGQRQQQVTGMQAYHLGMSVLREAAGDAWILACGAPMLPSVGYAESWRSGADIAFAESPDPDPAYVRWQARSTAARAFANGRWWRNDPDNLLVRAPLTEDEVLGAVAAQIASGGSWFLGDDLRTLPPERLALVTRPDLVALAGQRVRPEAPLAAVSGLDGAPLFEAVTPDDVVPVRWELASGHVILLNLGAEAIEVTAPGGTELFSGNVIGSTTRTLPAGAGEVWARE